jgi:formylglycine-generating enzyme required for sulfatase activity
VTFLEEAFGPHAAQPGRRLHQAAARAVLQALLPEQGTDIRGTMRPRSELLAASGYAGRPRDFEELLRLLDRELRLVTPSDPEGVESEPGALATGPGAGAPVAHAPGSEAARCYQLTHDYLVPALREWLTRKQKETRRGRAQLRLAERAALWNARPERRYLPSWAEYARIRLLTRAGSWTAPERAMMRQAGRHHAARGLVLAALVALVGWGAWEWHGRFKARVLRDNLLSAEMDRVPAVVGEMTPFRHWVDPLLRESLAGSDDPRERLRLGLALLPSDPNQVQPLCRRLFDVEPREFTVVRGQLEPYGGELSKDLWAGLADPTGERERRFRAACALAAYAPEDPRWAPFGPFVVDRLVKQEPVVLGYWKDALQRVGRPLLPALAASLEDRRWGDVQRRTITAIYRDFCAGQPDGFAPLEKRLFGDAGQKGSGESETDWAKRNANVAAALVALGRGDKVWPLLVHGDDPTVRSYLIERLGTAGIDPRVLTARLEQEPDVSARRALILALGGFGPDGLAADRLLDWYENNRDPGVHAAAGWLLRRWGRGRDLKKIDDKWKTGRVEDGRRWYVNEQGQTFVVLPAPRDASARRPQGEARQGGGRFAIAATEVTVEQFRAFRPDHEFKRSTAPTPDCPAASVSWYDAAEYCNWLSRKHGLKDGDLCYSRNDAGQMVVADDFLRRQGYRLPTEEEWVTACRAGARTPWAYGQADQELAGNYAWWYGNTLALYRDRTSPAGLLKPNDFGLFDMHGNVSEWCNDVYRLPAEGAARRGNPRGEVVLDDVDRAVHDGMYTRHFEYQRADLRSPLPPRVQTWGLGFRPARTLP